MLVLTTNFACLLCALLMNLVALSPRSPGGDDIIKYCCRMRYLKNNDNVMFKLLSNRLCNKIIHLIEMTRNINELSLFHVDMKALVNTVDYWLLNMFQTK